MDVAPVKSSVAVDRTGDGAKEFDDGDVEARGRPRAFLLLYSCRSTAGG